MSDKREAQRMEADYQFEYTIVGRENQGVGRALDQSETGLRFVTDQPIELGTYVTVRVPLDSEKVPRLTCPANVVSCLSMPDGKGYAVGCAFD